MAKSKDLRIEYMSIDELKHLDGNPKDHDIPKLIASIKRFGFRDPIEIDDKANTISSGHGRVTALAEMRLRGDRPPRFVRAIDGITWLAPVVRGGSFKNKKERDAYAISANKIGEGLWDDDALGTMMAQFDTSDLDSLGFSEDEWAELVGDADDESNSSGTTSPHNADDDKIPTKPKAITKPGDTIDIGKHQILCGDCVALLRTLDDNSVDAIVTDPPYGISMMGKDWDCDVPGDKWAAECLRVLKPGGRMIAFGATRTIHRIACTLEDAGLEITDMIGWLTWQGFPKSFDLSKAIDDHKGAKRKVIGKQSIPGKQMQQMSGDPGNDKNHWSGNIMGPPKTKAAKKWAGWGTALKPTQEPAIMARKPLEGTYAENVLKWGVGGINVDGCRFDDSDPAWIGIKGGKADWSNHVRDISSIGPIGLDGKRPAAPDDSVGRWPANVYYCPKPSRAEREAGCDDLPSIAGHKAVNRKKGSKGLKNPRAGAGRTAQEIKNHHITVKPVQLMRWLVRLITPPGGLVVDTFLGSGTTMLAAEREGMRCIGMERDPHYCDISIARVKGA